MFAVRLKARKLVAFSNLPKNLLFILFLIAGSSLLLFLSLVSASSLCIDNVENRRREIAILESLNFSKRSIYPLFFAQNSFAGFWASLFSIALVYPGLWVANSILKSPGVFNLSYDLLTLSPYILIIGIACALSITVLSTFLPLKKISKIDILDVLKIG